MMLLHVCAHFVSLMVSMMKVSPFCLLVPFSNNSNGGGVKRQKIGKYSSATSSFKSSKNQHIKVDDLH